MGLSKNVGEANSQAKLTTRQVRTIRRLYERGDHSALELAARYDVSKELIHKIVSRRIWTHV